MLAYAVYILQCTNEQYYTGFTTNIAKRLKAHSAGEVHFTRDKLPVKVVHLSYFKNKQKAYNFERYLKSGRYRFPKQTTCMTILRSSSNARAKEYPAF